MRNILAAFSAFLLANASLAQENAADQPLNVYIDADYTISWQIAQSIEQGLTAAFASHGLEAAGQDLQIMPFDHRTNARRSLTTLQRFDADENGIVVVGGKHSPPYIRHADEISEMQIPLISAWAASRLITRHRTGDENWVFRLSVDDMTVGPFLAEEMVTSGCERPGIVVLDNPWGLGNLAGISASLQEMETMPVYEARMATEIGTARASHIVAEMSANDVDCMAIVGNGANSARVLNAIDELGLPLRVFSHWGLLEATFADDVPHDIREDLDLRIVQTCGLTPERRNTARLEDALTYAAGQGWDYDDLSDVPAPAAFVHGFDLGLLVVAAIEQAAEHPNWHQDVEVRRHLFRAALEDLEQPIQGILRLYDRPFSPVTATNMSGHEALSGMDLCLVYLDERARLIPMEMAAATDIPVATE